MPLTCRWWHRRSTRVIPRSDGADRSKRNEVGLLLLSSQICLNALPPLNDLDPPARPRSFLGLMTIPVKSLPAQHFCGFEISQDEYPRLELGTWSYLKLPSSKEKTLFFFRKAERESAVSAQSIKQEAWCLQESCIDLRKPPYGEPWITSMEPAQQLGGIKGGENEPWKGGWAWLYKSIETRKNLFDTEKQGFPWPSFRSLDFVSSR